MIVPRFVLYKPTHLVDHFEESITNNTTVVSLLMVSLVSHQSSMYKVMRESLISSHSLIFFTNICIYSYTLYIPGMYLLRSMEAVEMPLGTPVEKARVLPPDLFPHALSVIHESHEPLYPERRRRNV